MKFTKVFLLENGDIEIIIQELLSAIEMKRVCIIVILMFIGVSIYASNQRDTLKASSMNIHPNREVIINKDVDLRGNVLPLPKGVTLNFKGGVLKNGVIIGNDTKIKCKKQAFDHIEIKGSWNVAKIYSTWFKDLSYVNALKNVIALTNPKVKNKVEISRGNYLLQVNKSGQSGLLITDNTELIFKGTIRLLPNSFTNYYIINVTGNNVKIAGAGTIYGDKHTHTGTTGEWGMGINLKKATNVSISGLTIKDCWGDCIYIGTKSENVLVENCTLDHGRRQGVSVTSGNLITLQNLKITNVGGTKPGFGIDIEPNKNEVADKVLIDNVMIDKCEGGILIYGKASGARVGKVEIKKCVISKTKVPISARKCESLDVIGCTLTDYTSKEGISLIDVGKKYIKNNTIRK